MEGRSHSAHGVPEGGGQGSKGRHWPALQQRTVGASPNQVRMCSPGIPLSGLYLPGIDFPACLLVVIKAASLESFSNEIGTWRAGVIGAAAVHPAWPRTRSAQCCLPSVHLPPQLPLALDQAEGQGAPAGSLGTCLGHDLEMCKGSNRGNTLSPPQWPWPRF